MNQEDKDIIKKYGEEGSYGLNPIYSASYSQYGAPPDEVQRLEEEVQRVKERKQLQDDMLTTINNLVEKVNQLEEINKILCKNLSHKNSIVVINSGKKEDNKNRISSGS